MSRYFNQAALVCASLTVSLFLAFSASAQVEQGRVVGQITDPQGSVVSGASVKLTNTGTNIVQTAETEGNGNYNITPVSAGTYRLSVSASGFETTTISGIEVQVGQIVREDLKMKLGSTSTTVEVTTSAPLLNTDSATVGEVVSNQQLTGLPLNRSEEHTSELQSLRHLVCRLLLEKKQ